MNRRGQLSGACFAVTILVLAASAGCRRSAPVDTSLMTGQPCEPPCWQGLVPGFSTEEDVNQFLRTSQLVDSRTIFRGTSRRNGEIAGVSIQWLSARNAQGASSANSFLIEEGVLQDIILHLDYTLTLDQLLERYGPPVKLAVGLIGVHAVEARVSLLYPEHGFIAYLALPAHDPSLQPDATVSWVWYYRAAPLDEFLELAREVGHYSGTVEVDSFRDWEGYGPIPMD